MSGILLSRIQLAKTLVTCLAAISVGLTSGFAQLANEPIPAVETLPEAYPKHWVFAHDIAFYALATGRVYIVDATAKDHDVAGMVDASGFASFSHSSARGELYVAETFYSRGMRGDRSDFLTIYDMATLDIAAQVELPGAKRSLSVTHKAALQRTGNDKFLLVFNFTPAASVSVFDLDKREVVNEIQLPGCMLIYPQGDAGFASFCGDGSMIAFALDENGNAISETRTDAFNTIDDDPLFMKTAYIGDTAYFTSFKGDIVPVTLDGAEPVIGERAYLAGAVRETAHGAYARPSGWQVITADDRGRLYILMRPDAKDGDHKFGGSYVWVYDPRQQRVVREIALEANSISIEATSGARPLLVVTNEAMHLDIYDARSGEWLRKIGGWGPSTPFALHAVE